MRHGLNYIGTARVLHLAERRSIIDSAEDMVQRMAECGYRIWVRLFCDDLTGGEAACEGAGIHSVRRMLRTAIEWRDARVTEALAAT